MKKLINLLLIMMPLAVLNADVTLDYPGIPSKDVDDYKDELQNWSHTYDIELLDSSLNYVNNSLGIGFKDYYFRRV